MENRQGNDDIRGIAGVVFDAVGTLIEAHPGVAEVYAAVALRQGVALDVGEVRARFRRHFAADEACDAGGTLATDETRERRRWETIVGNVLPELPDPERGFAELWEHFASPSAWRCYPDVKPALDAFRLARLALCIGSNFDARLRSLIAGLSELAPCGDALVIASEVGFRKPNRAFFQAIQERLALPADRLLFVGDDPENDFAAAHRAGFKSVLIDRRQGAKSGPAFSSLTDLASAILR